MAFNIDGISQEKKETGVWVELDGSEFLIASLNTHAFRRENARLNKPHLSKIRADKIDPKVEAEIMAKTLAKTILLDWRKVVDGKGKDYPYTFDNCKNVLMNHDDLRNYVVEIASDTANYQAENESEGLKS